MIFTSIFVSTIVLFGLMATKLKQEIENIKKLSANERALVAYCQISSLEIQQDEDVEEAWPDLAEKRYAELVSGNVEPVSREEVRKEVKGQDAKNSTPPGNGVRN